MHYIFSLGSIFLVVHARFPCCTSNKIDSSKYLVNHPDINHDETKTLQERIGRRKRRRLEQELNNTKINYLEKWEEKRSITFKNSPMNQFNITDGVWQSQIGRVIGGTRVPLGRYNYMTQGIGNLACGGILIAPNIVLTAAHCLGGYRHAIVGIYGESFLFLYCCVRCKIWFKVTCIEMLSTFIIEMEGGTDDKFSIFLVMNLGNMWSSIARTCNPLFFLFSFS